MKIGRKKKWTEQQLVDSVKLSRSMAQVMKDLGLHPRGSNYNTIKRYIAFMGLDTSHFDGKPWTTNLRLIDTKSLRNTAAIKERIIEDRGHQCEDCKLTEWKNLPIPLELHHVDGNHNNNEETNLQLACPNCHAQTPSWRRRK